MVQTSWLRSTQLSWPVVGLVRWYGFKIIHSGTNTSWISMLFYIFYSTNSFFTVSSYFISVIFFIITDTSTTLVLTLILVGFSSVLNHIHTVLQKVFTSFILVKCILVFYFVTNLCSKNVALQKIII